MLPIENGFRTRAASLLHSASPFRSNDSGANSKIQLPIDQSRLSPLSDLFNEKSNGETLVGNMQGDAVSSSGRTLRSSTSNARSPSTPERRQVRLTPAWVHTIEEDDIDGTGPLSPVPEPPAEAQLAQHNSNPAPRHRQKHEPGRRWDLEREAWPPTPTHHINEFGSRWRTFADVSAYPREAGEKTLRVTEDWLLQNGADYSEPWKPDDSNLEKQGRRAALKAKQKIWWKTPLRVMLRSPVIPLIIRMTVWINSLIAMALGAAIYRSGVDRSTTSTKMAIIIDAVALIYILYITKDEYTGKPLGLRSAKAKMRLIFLDLFFIVFNSANLSLAFEGISGEHGTCGSTYSPDCGRQVALACVLLLVLIAWLMTFSISVLRLIERVVPDE